ncbi:3-keto-5-aminohexanoate cleavage protein [Magnetospira sp. QH-2]|uniref:3-keto-5-aminohexanoate cleavage protein n=1 Tax=Magnetospira sp. (strain QH-2) TaxID=1288970 RepID=UPI0003E81420|nr:3-keto-5-aminohexanoate cleavage protein [Magnetospira sp. QH-2]CCQ73911.1 Conserved protein of unknown function [Magnetospira sp. QH-2]
MINAPVVIAVAPNGARRTKADHPALPVTPAELAQCAKDCLSAGASMIHLHVRDAEQRHVLDAGLYREALAAVKEVVEDRMVVQITTEAGGIYEPQGQMEVVRQLRPDAVSLAVRELMAEADLDVVADFLDWMADEGIATQYILHTPDDAMKFRDLRRRKFIPGTRPAVLYVLGRYTDSAPGDPAAIFPFLEMAGGDEGSWMVCAFGRSEVACAATAAALGGHVRIGFENNTTTPYGKPLADNAEQVVRVRETLERMGRPAASGEDARRILGLREGS